MALLKQSEDEKKFDTRVVEKNLTRNRVSQKDADQLEKSLPDDATNAEWVSIEQLKSDDSTS